MNSIFNLEGKVGLITGMANSSSIAYGVAKAARDAGARLAITYQNEKTAGYTRALAEELGAELFELCDVREPGSMEGLFEKVGSKFGKLDFALHSMAYATKDDLHGRVVDCSLGGLSTAMEVSCWSFMRMAQLAEPLMSDGGTLLTMTYHGADKVVENYGVMGVVKAALESATRYMAHELGPKGIRVHAVSPGPMATRAASGIAHFDGLMEQAQAKAPLHRLVTLEEVGGLAAFLCSDAGRGMTGSLVYVDGGCNIVG